MALLLAAQLWAVAPCRAAQAAEDGRAACRSAFRQGLELARAGAYGRAYRVWRSALRTYGSAMTASEQARVGVAMATACLKAGREASARKCLAFARRKAPESGEVQRLATRLEPPDAFSTTFSKAMDRLDYATFLESLSAGQGRPVFEELTVVYQEALKRGYEPALAHYGLGACLAHTAGREDEAAEHLRESLRLAPRNPKVYYMLSVVAERDGALSAAVEDLDRCYSLGCQTSLVLERLALVRLLRDRASDRVAVVDLAGRLAKIDLTAVERLAAAADAPALRARLEELVASERARQEGTGASTAEAAKTPAEATPKVQDGAAAPAEAPAELVPAPDAAAQSEMAATADEGASTD